MGWDRRCIYQPLCTGRILQKVNFSPEFEFKMVLLVDRLLDQIYRTEPALIFTNSWKENNLIHTFSKGISAM